MLNKCCSVYPQIYFEFVRIVNSPKRLLTISSRITFILNLVKNFDANGDWMQKEEFQVKLVPNFHNNEVKKI